MKLEAKALLRKTPVAESQAKTVIAWANEFITAAEKLIK